MSEIQKKSAAFLRFDASGVEETASLLSGGIFFLIGAMLVFSVVAFGAVDLWALGVLSFVACSITVLWLADAWFKREFRFNSSMLQIPLLGLIFIGLIQLLPLRSSDISNDLLSIPAAASLSVAPYATRLALVQLFVYFIFFAAAYTFINNRNRLRKIVLFIVIFSALMAFYGILQRLANLEEIYGLRPIGQASPFGPFINGHHFAAFMEMSIGVTFALLFGKATKENKRVFLMIAVLMMGIALVFTSSRGGMLSLFGVIGFVITANLLRRPNGETNPPVDAGKNYRRNFSLIGGSLALILVLFGAVLLLGGDESLLRGTGLVNPEDISNGRTHFWQIALKIFLDYPIFGAGLDSFATAFSQYDTWNGTFRVEQAHNDYLQILADAGILGFACVAAFIFLLFRHGLRTIGEATDSFRRNVSVGALAGCCGVLIHSFFDFPLRTPSNALFFLTLAVLATAPIALPKPIRHKRKK